MRKAAIIFQSSFQWTGKVSRHFEAVPGDSIRYRFQRNSRPFRESILAAIKAAMSNINLRGDFPLPDHIYAKFFVVRRFAQRRFSRHL